jgi:hypothetical protein
LNTDSAILSQLWLWAGSATPAILYYLGKRYRARAQKTLRRICGDAIHIWPATLSIISFGLSGGFFGLIAGLLILQTLEIVSVIELSAFVGLFALIGAYFGDRLIDPLVLRLGNDQPGVILGTIPGPDGKHAPIVFWPDPKDGRRIEEFVREQPPSKCHACGGMEFSIRIAYASRPWWKVVLFRMTGYGGRAARICKKCGAGFVKLRREDRTWIWYPNPRWGPKR